MKNLYINALMALCSIVTLTTQAQTDTTHYKYGIWQTFGEAASTSLYPEIQGRLANFRWADIEPSPNVWNWAAFDDEMASKAKDGLPFIFLMYTKEDAPDWLYSNGVPKVTEKDVNGTVIGYSPYYMDADYKSFFKRMITKVHEHIETLPANVRTNIIGVQPCFGSTGDYISYKGEVAAQYALSDAQFYQLFQEFTLYYWDEYKFTSPKIYILSNPKNNGEEQTFWLMANCPGGWIKTGTLGKGYQLNYETDKAAWLYGLLNNPNNSQMMRARSEFLGSMLSAKWWLSQPYKNMFAIMAYGIHWGLDWNNQNIDKIQDHNYDPSFTLFNKYAGYKDAATSSNAMCMLKDVIDAADGVRFPASQYGTVALTNSRFNNVLAPFVPYGAKLEDMGSAMGGEMENIAANGTNDVGWKLFPGNYEKFIHQINANETSAGYWNVASAEPNTSYGRFARGFDLAKGKDALYFDVEDSFLHNAALDGAYPVIIEVTYLDKGNGKFQLFYDGKTGTVPSSMSISCTNTNKWKTVAITLNDAYFGNRAANGADFFIKNTGSENVIFQIVELSRSGNGVTGSTLSYSNALIFDTICITSTPDPLAVSITGLYLDNSNVVVGPLKGFSFATARDGVYSDSIIISQGAKFTQSLYVKFRPDAPGSYSGNIPVYGGGASKISLPVSAAAMNSAPDVTGSTVNNVTCYNSKNGSIDLKPAGGQGPFTYSWVSSATNFKSTAEDINALVPSTYTVNINAAYGCKTTASFTITQPEVLITSVSADPMQCKGGTTNVYVTATGGTMPYTGTGTFVKSSGFITYTVTDKNGCTDNQGFSAPNGTGTAPEKPGTILSPDADITGVCGPGTYTFSVNAVKNATSYVWTLPAKATIASTSIDGRTLTLNALSGFNGGSLQVAAGNTCGTSRNSSKTLKVAPQNPGGIVGPQKVKSGQAGLVYTTSAVSGLTYKWTVPSGAKITSGQNTPSITVTWGSRDGSVKVTANNKCESSGNTILNITVGTTTTTSTKTTTETATVTASPNPARSVTYLSFGADVDYRYTIEITDMSGKTVIRKSGVANQGNNKIPVNVSSLTDGLYNVTIINNDNGEKLSTKLVKG